MGNFKFKLPVNGLIYPPPVRVVVLQLVSSSLCFFRMGRGLIPPPPKKKINLTLTQIILFVKTWVLVSMMNPLRSFPNIAANILSSSLQRRNWGPHKGWLVRTITFCMEIKKGFLGKLKYVFVVFFSDPCCVAVAEHGESTAVAEGGGGAEVVVSDGSLFF